MAINTLRDRKNHIRGLAEAVRQIAREQAQTEEVSNYFEVLRFFQNPPNGESDGVISKGSKK